MQRPVLRFQDKRARRGEVGKRYNGKCDHRESEPQRWFLLAGPAKNGSKATRGE